jgi:site-specific recombinase XerD
VSELCDVQWNQIDFTTGVIHVRRLKGSVPSTQPLTGREMRALRKLQRDGDKNPFVFVNERKEPFSPAGFARMLQRATVKAGLGIKVHPHNLRHACGYKLANDGVDTRSLQVWLGHKKY